MNANELITQVQECRSERWQNSDISSGGERLLEIIAAHYETCEECRQNFDEQEYEETTLIDLWHRFMAVNEAPEEWICEEGLQALFDHPLYVYLVTIENSDPSEWYFETSEPGARFGLEKRFSGAEFGDFELCEEPEAVENEYVMMVTVAGETVARIYRWNSNRSPRSSRGRSTRKSWRRGREMAFVKRTITIREDQDVWIKARPEINLSGKIQHWLDNLIEAYEQH